MQRDKFTSELNKAILSNNKALILYYCAQLEQIGQSGLDVTSIKLKTLTSLGHWKYTIQIYDTLGDKVYNNDSLAIGYFDALYQAERFDELFNHIAQVETRQWLSETALYIETAMPHIEKYKSKSQMEAEANLTCQAEVPLLERVKLSFLSDEPSPKNEKMSGQEQEPKILLEASHLIRMLALGKRPTGIQRFIAELVNSLSSFTNHIHIVYYRPEDSIPRKIHADVFLKILNSTSAEVKASDLIFGNLRNATQNYLTINASDKLIILDAFWAQSAPRLASFVEEATCETMLFIYDLIPIRDQSSPANTKDFQNSLELLLNYIDKVITCSHTTKADVEALLTSIGKKKPVIALPLAASNLTQFPAFSVRQTHAPSLNNQSIERIINTKFILTVSTITKRKRVLELAEAFSKTIQTHDHDLVIVGADPGMDSELSERIDLIAKSHPERIICLGDVSDQQLEQLYENCSFFSYLSIDEGWGLPIGEALAYGKVPLVHRKSTIPEVAGDLAYYCAEDEASIINAICDLTIDEKGRRALEARIKENGRRSWAEVADDFLSIILKDY